METYILAFALILFATKFCGILTKSIHLPQVVGALIAGILLGPSVLGLVGPSETLSVIAELGVIVLLFSAGMEMNFKKLKSLFIPALLIAVMGFTLALAGGYFAASVIGRPPLESFFIGVVIASTSTSITIEALSEMNKLKSDSGQALLSVAVIDDILGVITLSIMLGIVGGGAGEVNFDIATIGILLLKILLFFVFATICGFIMNKLLSFVSHKAGECRLLSIFALAFCFLMSFLAEQFGLANIAGAFIAGIAFCNTQFVKFIEDKTQVLSYMFLSPVFFASIGINMVLDGFNSGMIVFTALLLVAAMLSKLVGCGVGAKICRFKNRECFQIGTGMITRGEVSIIVASKGIAVGLMDNTLFSCVIIVVLFTVLVAPTLLKLAYKGSGDEVDTVETIEKV
jgi:Kef-type K+ transport system membrane component KefB